MAESETVTTRKKLRRPSDEEAIATALGGVEDIPKYTPDRGSYAKGGTVTPTKFAAGGANKMFGYSDALPARAGQTGAR
jgi:hypothetical protein